MISVEIKKITQQKQFIAEIRNKLSFGFVWKKIINHN